MANMAPSARFTVTAAHIGAVIDAVARDDFFTVLMRALSAICGAEHCAIYQCAQDKVSELGAGSLDGSATAHERVSRYVSGQHWRRDPAMSQVRQVSMTAGRSIVRTDLARLPLDFRKQFFPDIRDRLLVCGQRRSNGYCISILRSDSTRPFSAAEINSLGGCGDTIVSVIAKHAEVLSRRPHLALASLAEIEACMRTDGRLSRREVEVSARLLYGMTSTGIALDLGISEETVKTYRNRAYLRLRIGSPRELLMWYLAIWNPCAAAAPDVGRCRRA